MIRAEWAGFGELRPDAGLEAQHEYRGRAHPANTGCRRAE